MKAIRKYLGLALILTLCISLSGCNKVKDDTVVKVGALKGPTAIGLMKLMDDSANNKALNAYSFEIATAADEILPKMISKDLDIALVPANVAAILYNKSEGNIKVIDINTLGVLYAVSSDESIKSVKDLENKTVYVTGQKNTPDYITQYLLKENNVDISLVNIEYKSEAAEVAALLNEKEGAVGILPQPFVTACCIKNENLKIVLDLTKEWDDLNKDTGSKLVTGVTVVRADFLAEHESIVKDFLKEHQLSAEFVSTNLEDVAKMVVDKGIIEKEPLAMKAIPNCNITYMDKDSMKEALSGYLNVLYTMDKTTVGGQLPDEEFYY